jgi:hypothetical protein
VALVLPLAIKSALIDICAELYKRHAEPTVDRDLAMLEEGAKGAESHNSLSEKLDSSLISTERAIVAH